MRITIIRDDDFVSIDGRQVRVDLSGMISNYHAVHWDGAAGYIETKRGDNIQLKDLTTFQAIIARAQKAIAAEDAAEVPTP